jgi:hypothetical protein
LAIGATIVLLGLVLVAGALRQRRRDRVLDLIIEGRGSVPIAAVQRERRRLRAPRTQRLLARTIEGMIEQALNPPNLYTRGARPLFEVAVVAAVAEELWAVSQLLRTEHISERGVALAERLLTDGTSPFYGDQPCPLREELHRIRHLLQG